MKKTKVNGGGSISSAGTFSLSSAHSSVLHMKKASVISKQKSSPIDENRSTTAMIDALHQRIKEARQKRAQELNGKTGTLAEIIPENRDALLHKYRP